MKMIGIIDEFGIENFIPLEGHIKEVFLFFIRAKINFNAVFFCLDFTDKEINKINNLISSHEVKSYNEAGIFIVERLNKDIRTDKLLKRFYKLRERL